MQVILAVVIALLAEMISTSPVSSPKSNDNPKFLYYKDARSNLILLGEAEAASQGPAGGKGLVKIPPTGQGSVALLLFPGPKTSFGRHCHDGVGADGVPFPSASTRGNVLREECSFQAASLLINGTCQRFLTRGSCAEGQWLVLRDKRALCEPRPCPFGQLKYKEKCVSVSDFSVCKEGRILYVEFSGFVICDCEPHYIYDVFSGKCYAQQVKGPCNFGEYLQLSDSGASECVPNECDIDCYVKNDVVTSKCYRKINHGFCSQDLLILNTENNIAKSSAVNPRNILDVTTLRVCAEGSGRDELSKCREYFIIPTSTSVFALRGRCPTGFVNDSKGDCRRVNKLLV